MSLFLCTLVFNCVGCLTKEEQVVIEAEKYLGVSYEYGGETTAGIDCSSLMQQSFRIVGCKLPRTSAEQSKLGRYLPLSKVHKGDLLFFGTEGTISHVGLVVSGEGEDCEFIHASGIDGKVLKTKYATSERRNRFVKARRIF